MKTNIQNQEISIRKQKENWLEESVRMELYLMRIATFKSDHDAFWQHFSKFLYYETLHLGMIRENLNNILNN